VCVFEYVDIVEYPQPMRPVTIPFFLFYTRSSETNTETNTESYSVGAVNAVNDEVFFVTLL
jgi:hypothetical protein